MGVEVALKELSGSPELITFQGPTDALATYNRERRRDLVQTQETIWRKTLAEDANASEAVDQLFLYRNSLLYRPAHIEKSGSLTWKMRGQRWSFSLGC